jgi:glycosyltransferase involved in cell wall biosynthesis
MRIAVNTLFLLPGQVGGTEIYTRSLLAAMTEVSQRHRLILFTNRENHDTFDDSPSVRRVRCPVSAVSRPRRILWEQLALPWQIRRQGADVILSPGFTTPICSGRPTVVTVHDLIWRSHPENFPRFYRLFLETLIPLSARRAERVIAVSRFTAAQLCRTYGVPQEKIRVIHEAPSRQLLERAAAASPAGPATRERLGALGVGAAHILCVSTLAPHKNVERLLQAFRQVKTRLAGQEKFEGLQLVLTGIKGRAHQRVQEEARRLELGASDLLVTGWVDEQSLADLYRTALLFAYPSLHEGFGLPLLEAMAFGVPVASSNAASLPEVGGDAVFWFDPEDVEQMAAVLVRALSDRDTAARMARRGAERCRLFSWEHAARQTIDLLLEAAGRPPEFLDQTVVSPGPPGPAADERPR